MKKINLLISLIISLSAWSQSDKKHEIKIDALSALVTPAIEISYEYTLNNYSSVGVSTFFRIDSPNDDYEAFSLAPYFRQYFFNNQSYGQKGFYIEALLQYTNGKRDAKNIDPDNNPITLNNEIKIDTYNDLGVGFGGGYKWITTNGFSVDIGADVGRNFGIGDNSPDFFIRWGINLGYRFF